MAHNAAVISARYFFIDLLGGIVFFPVWWYSRGLVKVGRAAWRSIADERRTLAIGIWIRNLFVPMYNVHDLAGRLISFFIRLVQIFGRTVVLGVYVLLVLVVVAAYIALPVLVVVEMVFHAIGSLTL